MGERQTAERQTAERHTADAASEGMAGGSTVREDAARGDAAGEGLAGDDMVGDEAGDVVVPSRALMDDERMGMFFAGQAECAEMVLRAVTERPDLHVTGVDVGFELTEPEVRHVKIDVRAQDDQGRRFLIEMRRASERVSPRHARYCASRLDARAYFSEVRRGVVPDTVLVYITDGDVLGRGLPLYQFEQTEANTGVPLGDGQQIIFANAAFDYEEGYLGDAMHDLMCADPEEMRCPVMAARGRELGDYLKVGLTRPTVTGRPATAGCLPVAGHPAAAGIPVGSGRLTGAGGPAMSGGSTRY